MIQLIKDQLTAAGTDTYTSALVTKYTSLQKGIYVVTFTNANTGAATLNVDGLSAMPIVDSTGSAITAGFIGAGNTLMLIFDGTSFIVSGSVSTSGFELIANKAIDFSTLNNTLYPSIQAVNSRILSLISGLAPYFYYKTVSDIGGAYYEMKGIPSTGGAQTIVSAGVTNAQVLATFVTVAGVPGVTSIATGVIKFNSHATQTAGTKTTQLYAEVYKRNLAGTETLLATSAYSSVIGGVSADYNFDASIGALITLLTTDRIVTKIIALVSGPGSAPNITITVEDNTAARTEMPFAPVSAQGSTGTGSLVYNTSPTLVTPALGTPSALVGTNITGTAAGLTAGTVTTNANLTGAITSVGNATSLGSFTSANLASALTDETGTGVAVFNNNPTLIAPVLGDASATTLLMAGDPTLALQVATKAYVDNLITGLMWKSAVNCATTANITLSGEQTIDGFTTSASRVLVKNQSTASQNGIYLTSAGAWTRTTDADTGAEIQYAALLVDAGSTYAATQWTCTNSTLPVIGVTSITWGQVAGAGTYTAGTGLTVSSNVFSIDSTVATLTGSQVLTNKTLTSPTINGGTSYFDSLSYVAAGFKVRIWTTDAMTADRTLTIQMNNGNRVLNLSGNLDLSNNLVTAGGGAITFNAAGTTNVTIPSTGTLYGTATGSITSAQLAASLTNETGTGSVVFGTSPTLVTPNLGTPSTLVGTNITGTAAGLTAGTVTTNANLTGHITSVGNVTSLGSFTSAQLATALTDETGSGANVFGTSPTITGGAITMLTSFGVKSTAAAFSMKIANVTAITADRTLTIDIGDAARSVNFLGGTVTFNNSFTTGASPITLTTTNTTNVTLPTSGTLYGTATGSITSLQLLTSLTDETGTGANVFGTSPTITTSLVAGSASMSLFNTTATTVSAFAVASQLDISNLTTTQAVNIACGIMATGNAKNISIGTNGAVGSTTTISIGTATAATSSTIYLNGDVINLSGKSSTFTGHNINVGSDASYDMWHRGTGAGLTRIANGTTGQALVATTGAAPAFAFVVPRQTNLTSSATPTPNLDNEDQLNVTALAVGATIGAPTGTFAGARKLVIRIKDNGTSQTLAYNAIFRVIGVILPAATVINKTIYLGCIYNAADTKWDVVAYQLEV